MLRAVLDGTVLAEAPHTVRVEGNHYFPPETVDQQQLSRSRMKTLCPWKGIAGYYHVTADGTTFRNVAWSYAHPSPLARRIRNHIAFSGPVTIEGQPEPTESGHGTRRRPFRRAETS